MQIIPWTTAMSKLSKKEFKMDMGYKNPPVWPYVKFFLIAETILIVLCYLLRYLMLN